jgi:hypothetical protein
MPFSLVPSTIRGKLAASASGLLFALFLSELALRAIDFEHAAPAERGVVWNRERDRELRAGDGLYRFDPDCLWSPRPGAPLPWAPGERINAHGLRGPELARARTPGTLRILLLGAGATLGVDVAWRETYAARTVERLAERGVRAEVLCAGVEEHTSLLGLERWRAHLREWKPDVLACSLLGHAEVQPAPRGLADGERLAEQRRHPRQPGPPALHERLRLVHLVRWLADLAAGDLWPERELEHLERRLEPTCDELDWPGQRRLPIEDHVRALGQLIEEARADGAHTILLRIPRLPSERGARAREPYDWIVPDVAWRHGARYVDGRFVFSRVVRDQGVPKEDLFLADTRPSECGHLALANALADEILVLIGKHGR